MGITKPAFEQAGHDTSQTMAFDPCLVHRRSVFDLVCGSRPPHGSLEPDCGDSLQSFCSFGCTMPWAPDAFNATDR